MRRLRSSGVAVVALSLALHALAGAATWNYAHGDAANTSFADVATQVPGTPVTVRNIGTYAAGAGPVVAGDGTVYLGSEQGDLRAFRPDGTLLWKRNIEHHLSIVASPVVDDDGSIYVVGTRSYTDHRNGADRAVNESWLFRFGSVGQLLVAVPFPNHDATVAANAGTGRASASPNLWKFNGQTAVLVPAFYRGLASTDVRLIAFSTNGTVLGDQLVGANVSKTFGDNGKPWWFNLVGCLEVVFCFVPAAGLYFCPHAAPDPSGLPPMVPQLSNVAVYRWAGGGTPWIAATDQASTMTVFTFDPAHGLVQRSRRTVDGDLVMFGAPAILPDGHSVAGTTEEHYVGDEGDCSGFKATTSRLVFGLPNGNAVADVNSDAVAAPPARTADGRIVVVTDDTLDVYRGTVRTAHLNLPAATIAAPSVSRTHIFLSTFSGLLTWGATTLTWLGTYAWDGGGYSSPAIAGDGSLYALARNVLYLWRRQAPRPVGSRRPLSKREP